MEITLNFWTPRDSRDGIRERIYVTPVALNGERADALGYFEQCTAVRARDPHSPSYYERHRYIKGETVAYEPAIPEWHGPADLLPRVLAACADGATLADWEREPTGLFMRLCDRSRGFRYFVCGLHSRDKARRARAREVQAGNEARERLSFALAE